MINIRFFENEDYNSEISGSDIALDLDLNQLNGILNLCLIKYVSLNIEDSEIKKIKSKEIANIITSLKNNIEFKDELLEDIKSVLKEKSGNNILVYSEYVNMVMTKDKTENLLNLLEKRKQEKIKLYWNKLSKYENINQSFEKDFKLALKQSYFDYSVISISIKEQKNLSNYIQSKKECDNCETKFLYHGTQIDPISKIITTGFLYSRKPFYGLGIYFSDMIDYIEFYCGGETYEDRRKNFGKNLSVGESFSFVASEVYYDKNKIKNIYNYDYYIDELDHFPTYEEIKGHFSDKMVEKNGIHFAKVEPEQGEVKDEYEILSEKKRGKFLGTEFVITEMNQIFPLFGITLKRNEYFVIWRDPNYEDKNNYSTYLQVCKNFLNEKANMNVYFESCTENALELIKRKKFNKIIIISSVGLDLSGKKFIEVARKILGFKAMILFYSANKNHLEWIQHFPNALYTNNDDFYQKYVTNYNENGLKNLKKEIQKEYNIKLPEFTKDFIKFPKFVDKKKYSDMIFDEINDNFRKVLIKNKKADKMLCIENEQIYFKSFDENKDISFVWFITIIDNEITFYSNGVYLGVDKFNEKVVGEKYMKRWSFEKINDRYKFYFVNN